MHGHGNYQILPKSFVLSNAAWCQKNEDAGESQPLSKFLSVSTAKEEKALTSTDGKLKTPETSPPLPENQSRTMQACSR